MQPVVLVELVVVVAPDGTGQIGGSTADMHISVTNWSRYDKIGGTMASRGSGCGEQRLAEPRCNWAAVHAQSSLSIAETGAHAGTHPCRAV
jgi:hypothetical protein